MFTLLMIVAAITALLALGALLLKRKPYDPDMCAANSYATALPKTHDGRCTKLADAAISTRYLLYKIGSDANHIAVTAATDTPIGTVDDEAAAAEDEVNVNLLNSDRTHKMVANAAITAGVPVFAAASGKIAPTGTVRVGIALSAASTDGDVIEVEPQPSSRKGGIITIPLNLASIANGDVLTEYPLGFAGTITKVTFAVSVPVTTGSKLTTLNLEIGTTNLTGGVVALTSALCTPIGALVAGSAVTAANTFAAADVLSIEASSTTAFSEGAGYLLIEYTAN